MKKNKPLCSSQSHFFEDKKQQSPHFFEDTFAEILHFFEDNALYAVLDSKSTPTKIRHPSIKYPTKNPIFAHNKVSKRTSYKGSKPGTLDTLKARKSTE